VTARRLRMSVGAARHRRFGRRTLVGGLRRDTGTVTSMKGLRYLPGPYKSSSGIAVGGFFSPHLHFGYRSESTASYTVTSIVSYLLDASKSSTATYSLSHTFPSTYFPSQTLQSGIASLPTSSLQSYHLLPKSTFESYWLLPASARHLPKHHQPCRPDHPTARLTDRAKPHMRLQAHHVRFHTPLTHVFPLLTWL
jgi:hypothetical protein